MYKLIINCDKSVKETKTGWGSEQWGIPNINEVVRAGCTEEVSLKSHLKYKKELVFRKKMCELRSEMLKSIPGKENSKCKRLDRNWHIWGTEGRPSARRKGVESGRRRGEEVGEFSQAPRTHKTSCSAWLVFHSWCNFKKSLKHLTEKKWCVRRHE